MEAIPANWQIDRTSGCILQAVWARVHRSKSTKTATYMSAKSKKVRGDIVHCIIKVEFGEHKTLRLLCSCLCVGATLDVSVPKNKQAYLLCMEGSVGISSTSSTIPKGAEVLSARDSAEVYGAMNVTLTATSPSHLLLLSMPTGRPGSNAIEHSEL